MKIGDVSQKTGIPASTLRYYEQIGLLPKASKSSGQRRYRADVIPMLRLITLAKEVGFSLAEIQALLNGVRGDEQIQLTLKRAMQQKVAELDRVIDRYRTMKDILEYVIECGCLDNTLLEKHGLTDQGLPR